MFNTIFRFELSYWLREYTVYVYAGIFFFLSAVTMWGLSTDAPTEIRVFSNAPMQLFKMADFYSVLLLLLIPAIAGMAIYRDYSSGAHAVLYSYPFAKMDYLAGKFLSAFLIVTCIGAMIGLGAIVGTQLPGADPRILLPFDITVYIQLYLIYLLPNMLLATCLAFAVVALTRNIYAGFIAVVLLLLLRTISGVLIAKIGSETLVALLDPMGKRAIQYYTRYWSSSEQNLRLLPMEQLVLLNRFIWISASAFLLGWVYKRFSFSLQAPVTAFKPQEDRQRTGETLHFDSFKPVYSFSALAEIRAIWRMSMFELRSMLSSWAFLTLLLGGFGVIMTMLFIANPRWETVTYPVTWQMLELPALLFSGIVNFITFLYAGMLIHRARVANTDQLVDISPWPNRVFLFSKLLAILKTQVIMLALLMIGGIATQISKGYYNFEMGHYLFELFILHMLHFTVFACLAFFMQTLIGNVYAAFFLLIFLPLGIGFIGENAPKFGLHFLNQAMFLFNQVPGLSLEWLSWSDLDGYGERLQIYFTYKFYWLLAGAVLVLMTLLFWQRGMPMSFRERISLAIERFRGRLAIGILAFTTAFLSVGGFIFYETNVNYTTLSKAQKRASIFQAEKQLGKYQDLVQPVIQDVYVEVDFFPSSRSVEMKGEYRLLNEHAIACDSLLIWHSAKMNTAYELEVPYTKLGSDTVAGMVVVDLVLLDRPLAPGDSLQMNFEQLSNESWLHRDRLIKGNGTLIDDDLLPRPGYWMDFVRKEMNMRERGDKPLPSDSSARMESFTAGNSDWIDFEAVLSTEPDQIAVTSGELQKSWNDEGRSYYHYKTAAPIPHAFAITSGRYAVKRDSWKGLELEIYYHPGHAYNIDRMMRGMKAALSYCSDNFSPFQFSYLRLVEFSQTGRVSAHAYPGVMPFGEGAGFIADVDDSESGGVDYPFSTAVHETAHQWWPFQILPADVRGAKVLSESMAEYVDVQVTRATYGEVKMRRYLKHSRRQYLRGRAGDRRDETPLMLTYPDQNHLNYAKGVLSFRTISERIGEDKFNNALRSIATEYRLKGAPFVTTEQLYAELMENTPDSLRYLVDDMLKSIVFYDNRVLNASGVLLNNGRYQVDVELMVRKYVADDSGVKSMQTFKLDKEELQSLPLNDYVDIAIFGEANSTGENSSAALYFKDIPVDKNLISLSVIVDEKPATVHVDPWFRLMEKEIKDNAFEVEMK